MESLQTVVVNISSYLTQEEIKDIIKDQVSELVRNHLNSEKDIERITSNIGYKMIWKEVDKTVPESRSLIAKRVTKCIKEKDFSYSIFRDKSSYHPESFATSLVNKSVYENKDRIDTKVKETIENRDYSDEIWRKFESLADTFISNIYSIVELGRSKK